MILNCYDIDLVEIYDKLGGKQTLPKKSLEIGENIASIQVYLPIRASILVENIKIVL